MLHKTRGIVLNYIKYKETSIIARVFTETFGTQSYIINSVRSKKSKKGMALLQPLSVLDMVVYHKKEKADGLQRMSEYKTAHNFVSIPFEIKKSVIALFVTELLSKVLKDAEDEAHIFEFLFQFVVTLDTSKDNYETSHLYLLVQLTHYLGFGITTVDQLKKDNIIVGLQTSFDQVYELIMKLNGAKLSFQWTTANGLRRDALHFMIEYYKLHVEGFKDMKSMEVLSQLFR